MIKVYGFILFFLCSLFSNAQDERIDSLKRVINSKIADTLRINASNELCWPIYSYLNLDSALKYGELALSISTRNKDTNRLIIAYRRLGIVYINKSDYKSALKFQQSSFDLAQKIKSKKGMAIALNNIGVVYLDFGDYKQAIEYSVRSQRLYEEIKDSINLFNTYYNVGLLYSNVGDFENSYKYYTKALIWANKSNNTNFKAAAYYGIGGALVKKKRIDSALAYFFISERLYSKINNKKGLVEVNTSIAGIYSEKKYLIDINSKKAFLYFNKALHVNKEYKGMQNYVVIYTNMASLYLKLNQVDSSIYYANKVVEIAKQTEVRENAFDIYEILSRVYYKKGNYKLGMDYLVRYNEMKDSLDHQERLKAVQQKQMRYEFERKSLADSLIVVQEKKISTERLKQEKTIRYSLLLFLVVLLFFSVFMFNRYKIINKQKVIIEEQKNRVDEKQKEIVDSIQYAKRIQNAMLMQDNLLTSYFPNTLIYFKPKDIVSGDFYWSTFKPFAPESKEGYFYLAVCDSTGHGVPGAFMSLLNSNFLNEAINEKNILAPNEIFDYVRNGLIHSISSSGQKDGFDGILLRFNTQTNEIDYAAANNAPIIISSTTLIQTEKDRMPVGKSENEKEFNLYKLNASKGDTVYLYTDGYADQFGGSNGKKFKSKSLNNLLQELAQKSISEQTAIIQSTFENWKGNLEQIDDVCVVGIKL